MYLLFICGSIRIRILVRLCRHEKMYFYMKNILYVGYRITYKVMIIPSQVQKPFERLEIR